VEAHDINFIMVAINMISWTWLCG